MVCAGIGKYQYKINEWCIKKGGHTRTGMEDNIRLNKNMLAPSNASLVKLAANVVKLIKDQFEIGNKPDKYLVCH